MNELSVSANENIYVGDAVSDVETGRNEGVISIAVKTGGSAQPLVRTNAP